jgi:hypothetical protein
MIRAAAALAATLALSGCFVYADPDPKPVRNAAPYISFAEAGCEPDRAYNDFVWWFDADIEDADGANDVSEVYVDVYDGWTGEWVDGFPLDPVGGVTWYSAWVGGSTYLDCTYPDYEVDFTAVDIFGATDLVTVIPYTW